MVLLPVLGGSGCDPGIRSIVRYMDFEVHHEFGQMEGEKELLHASYDALLRLDYRAVKPLAKYLRKSMYDREVLRVYMWLWYSRGAGDRAVEAIKEEVLKVVEDKRFMYWARLSLAHHWVDTMEPIDHGPPYWFTERMIKAMLEYINDERRFGVLMVNTPENRFPFRYCDVAVYVIEKFAGEDFGMDYRKPREEKDKAIERCKRWLIERGYLKPEASVGAQRVRQEVK